jgi:hypothetical protein
MNLVQDQVQQVGGSKSEGGRMGPPPAVSKPQTPTRGSNWQPWKKNVSNLILFSCLLHASADEKTKLLIFVLNLKVNDLVIILNTSIVKKKK